MPSGSAQVLLFIGEFSNYLPCLAHPEFVHWAVFLNAILDEDAPRGLSRRLPSILVPVRTTKICRFHLNRFVLILLYVTCITARHLRFPEYK
jgi:hypothetical protein